MSNDNKGNPTQMVTNPDLWRMSVPLEPDLYESVFKGVADFEMKDSAFPGIKWRWEFEICSGPNAGRIISGISNPRLSPGSTGLKFVQGLLGRDINPGDDVLSLIKECEGQVFSVAFEKNEKGKSMGVQKIFKKK